VRRDCLPQRPFHGRRSNDDLTKRKFHSSYPVHAGCVTASNIASSIPCLSDQATAEPFGDPLQPKDTESRTSHGTCEARSCLGRASHALQRLSGIQTDAGTNGVSVASQGAHGVYESAAPVGSNPRFLIASSLSRVRGNLTSSPLSYAAKRSCNCSCVTPASRLSRTATSRNSPK